MDDLRQRNIILFGPPGVGKGAQAEILGRSLGLVHLSTGEVIRDEIKQGSELGKKVEEAVSNGEFADDETVLGIILHRIDLPEYRKGFVMDGFPRNTKQAELLDAMLAKRGKKIDAAFFLNAPMDIVLERLTGRLICSRCKATYHRQFKAPRIEGICDLCKGKVIRRHDDNPEAHRKRLKAYHDKTEPLAEYYDMSGILRMINADQPIEAVAREIQGHFK